MSDPVSDLKRELIAAAERQQEKAVADASRGRWRRPSRRNRVLLVAATLPIIAAVGLLVSAPWNNAPGFLERAQAALTPPTGSILHYRWESETPADSGCATGPSEVWIDQTPPHAYRAFLTDCGGQQQEIGGELNTKQILRFEPPNTLVVPDLFFDVPPDPTTWLRGAIREGSAHDEGRTQLDGRTVERIRIDCPAEAPRQGPDRAPLPHCLPETYVYVDSETYFPVQYSIPGGFAYVGGKRYDLVVRFQAFEYLSRTPANLALTDIRAQHPEATGP